MSAVGPSEKETPIVAPSEKKPQSQATTEKPNELTKLFTSFSWKGMMGEKSGKSGIGFSSIEERTTSLIQKIGSLPTNDLISNGEMKEVWRLKLSKFVDNEFSHLPKCLQNEKNKEHLQKRIEKLITYWILSRETSYGKTEKEMRIIISNSINDIKIYGKEIAHHFNEDKEEISQKFFNGKKPIVLKEVLFCGSETHNKGRQTVFLIVKVDGERKKLVYKPRDIRLDAALASNQPNSAFERLNQFVKSEGVQPEGSSTPVCGTYRFLPKTAGDAHYGYVEFVEDVEDKRFQLTEQQALALAWKMGFNDRITQLLTLCDLHYENFIAIGDQVVFIDLEVGLWPKLPHSEFLPSGFIHSISAYLEGAHSFGLKESLQDRDEFTEKWVEAFRAGYEEANRAFFALELQEFIPSLEDDVVFREVPIATNELIHMISIPNKQVFIEDSSTKALEKFNLPEVFARESEEALEPLVILEDQLGVSFDHSDVPIFTLRNRKKGELYCNDEKLLTIGRDYNSDYSDWLETVKDKTISLKEIRGVAEQFIFILDYKQD